MGTSERRAREKTELRQEILDAARRIFVEEGVEALTMRRVAEAIEYSPTTIYLYFKDKSELIQAICDETFATLVRDLEALAAIHTDPLAYLDAGLRAYIAFGLSNPSHYWATFVVGARNVEYQYEGSMGQRAFEFLRSALRACMDAGRIRRGNVDADAQAIWSAMHGLVALQIADKSFPFVDRQTLITTLVTTLIRGLRP